MIKKLSEKSKPKPADAWSYIKIHQAMLQDKLRTMSYKKAIENNVKKDDIVLDLGCGTGILSFFAAKKGCKKIYAIDKSNIIKEAVKTARRNNLEKNIEFVKKDILRFRPMEKIDILIHDQIGTYIWEENIISKVAYIRDNFLKQNAIIIPSKIDLYLAPINYKTDLEKSIFFWTKKKYGIDFSNLGIKVFTERYKNALSPSIIRLKDTKKFLCKEGLAYRIDLMKETSVPQEITAAFKLKKNSSLSGICAYFKVYLDGKNFFSTKPRTTNTHWGQIFLPCIEEKTIRRNSVLNFKLFPKINPKEWKYKFEIE